MMKINKYLRLVFFHLAFANTISVSAQADFKNKRIRNAIDVVFDSYSDIDSLIIGFDEKIPTGMTIFKSQQENTTWVRGTPKNKIYYILSFEGDQYVLQKRFAAIYHLIYAKGHTKRIRKAAKEDSFVWILNGQTSKFEPRFKGKGGSYPNAVFKKKKLEELRTVLNTHYRSTIVPTGDSVLLFQAVVEKDGTLASEIELLVGEKDAFHDWFLETYDYYVKYVLTKSFHRARLYHPHLQNGQRRGLMDIFVRLNKDKTVTISGMGMARRFQMKNFKDDPKNPIFY